MMAPDNYFISLMEVLGSDLQDLTESLNGVKAENYPQACRDVLLLIPSPYAKLGRLCRVFHEIWGLGDPSLGFSSWLFGLELA